VRRSWAMRPNFHQVAMNLCTNGLQAMVNGGVLEVALDRADVVQCRRLSHGDLG
jgi:hypothetical protein